MLELSRRVNESIVIADTIGLKVLDIRRNQVFLGIHAPRDISIHRLEIFKRVLKQQECGKEIFTFPEIVAVLERSKNLAY